MALGIRAGRKRMARLLRLTGRAGIGGNTHKKRRKRPMPAPHDDRAQRQFAADAPNRLWCADITEHLPGPGAYVPSRLRADRDYRYGSMAGKVKLPIKVLAKFSIYEGVGSATARKRRLDQWAPWSSNPQPADQKPPDRRDPG